MHYIIPSNPTTSYAPSACPDPTGWPPILRERNASTLSLIKAHLRVPLHGLGRVGLDGIANAVEVARRPSNALILHAKTKNLSSKLDEAAR